MLVLTRCVGESIIKELPDGSTTTTTVLGVKGKQVRIGIKADPAITVHREEVYRRIQAEKAAESEA